PTTRGGIRNGITHLSARSIADIANRIEGFLRGPGGDQKVFAVKIPLRPHKRFHVFYDRRRLSKTARAHFPAGQPTIGGSNNRAAAPFESSQIGLCGRMKPHYRVHGRRKNHLSGKRKESGGQKI